MKKPAFRIDENLARCLEARRSLERRYKTREGLTNFLFALEQEPLPSPCAAPEPIRARAQPFQQNEVMRRCRRVRQELYARFKTLDEMHAWLMSLEKQPRTRRGVKTAATRLPKRAKTTPATRNSKPAHRS